MHRKMIRIPGEMNEFDYVELLNLVFPLIMKADTVKRKSISPHEKLFATIRFLATERSLKNMEYSTALSKSTLSIYFKSIQVILSSINIKNSNKVL